MNKYLTITLKSFVFIQAIFLIGMYCAWFVAPKTIMPLWNVSSISPYGMDNLRSSMSSLVLGNGIILLLAIFKKKEWYKVSLLVVTILTITRTFSYILNGFEAETLTIIILEATLLLVLYFLSKFDK